MLKVSRALGLLVRNETRLMGTLAKPKTEPAWDLVSAVCIERPALIVPPLNTIETKMKKLLTDLEYENSMKNDHEMRSIQDMERAQKKKDGVDDSTGKDAVITALDMEDKWKAESLEFKAEQILTEADKNQDEKSILRHLDKPLRLVLNLKLGNDTFWDLPGAKRRPGETMRQAAERAVISMCGRKIQFQVLGNAPLSFYRYTYPKKYREENIVGAKVFIFKAYLLNNDSPVWQDMDLKLADNIMDYKWLTYEELNKYLTDNVNKAVTNMLHSDD